MAAKTIENVCSRESQCSQGFITAEVGPALYYLFTHSTVDALRVSAISVSVTQIDGLFSLTQNLILHYLGVPFMQSQMFSLFNNSLKFFINKSFIKQLQHQRSCRTHLLSSLHLPSQALCKITRHFAGAFQSVIDQVGLPSILSCLVSGISRVQQHMLTMFAAMLASGAHSHRLVQDRVCKHFILF